MRTTSWRASIPNADQPDRVPSPDESALSGCRTTLVADDDPICRRLLQNRLQAWGYHVVAAEDGEKAWHMLQQPGAPPALVILDWLMPGIDGIELCRRIRQGKQDRYQYILLLSGRDDKRDVVEGLAAGADDYLTKPFDIGELRARLHAGMRILSLQQQLLQAQEELRFQATHDALTGIWNRGAILDLLTGELRRGQRSTTSTGILMADIDHFKRINDSYGHPAGDKVLREVANRMHRSLRAYDLVGRYGGEEFIAVLSNCSRDDLDTVAERTRRSVAEIPVVVERETITVTISVGGVVSGNGTPEVQLLSAADSALYEAKKNGRNRVVIRACSSPNAEQFPDESTARQAVQR